MKFIDDLETFDIIVETKSGEKFNFNLPSGWIDMTDGQIKERLEEEFKKKFETSDNCSFKLNFCVKAKEID